MWRTARFFIKHALFWLLVVFVGYWLWLDRAVIERFEQTRWALPARVYAIPLELFQGAILTPEVLQETLGELGYQAVASLERPGQYRVRANTIHLITRAFAAPDGNEPSRSLAIRFESGRITKLTDAKGAPVANARIEPLEIGAIHPGVFEDRILVDVGSTSPQFIKRLIAVEDRRFFEHPGVDLLGIARAAVRNISSGSLRQGGSTITQQLVKNLYLTRERTIRRKITESLMALSIEHRFDKQEILETYLNEIFVGQDGNRAIHGFGLGAQYYFGKPLDELNVAEQALLIGMIKGPTAYNPRTHPKRAKQRRKVVLDVLLAEGLLNPTEYDQARDATLSRPVRPRRDKRRYRAFIDLVHRRLLSNYDRGALQTQGLQIFTTLDVFTQESVATAARRALRRVADGAGKNGQTLQMAAVISDPRTAEVKAVLGGRDDISGFNRALDARRQIGSLVKPFIYAEALSRERDYHLATLIDDKSVTLTDERGDVWSPQNYDHTVHGTVQLSEALAKSYNLATVNLGLELGVDTIIRRIHKMGFKRPIANYPAVLLGAVDMTPFEVAQLYQAFANDGFSMPLRAIRGVLDATGARLTESHTEVKRVLDESTAYLSNELLKGVVTDGTARRVLAAMGKERSLAGKTGTSDGPRDAWFAGFGSNYLGVIWIGRDDNANIGLTGSSAAVPVWIAVMQALGIDGISLARPDTIVEAWVDPESGVVHPIACPDAIRIPINRGHGLPQKPCLEDTGRPPNMWQRFRKLF